MKRPVLVLFGPTASGKTALLERLFAGASPRAEIVSADSMQVYRGMDIGTAKPDRSLLARLPHHLIDIRNPDETFDVGDFVRLADAACEDIEARGLLPVVCGGTGFYLKHFVEGLPETPPSDPAVRESLQRELSERGSAALAEELSKVDPESAARIHPNDSYRLTRALEVFRVSGRPRSSYSSAARAGRPDRAFSCFSLERGRGELYRRINERTRAMFAAGLAEEFRALRAAGYGSDSPGLRAIGYREFFRIEGEWTSERMAAVEELVARDSRHYAKRQITFASSIPGMRALDAESGSDELARAIERVLTF